MQKWYQQIDLSIRELVYKLRNSGVNTVSSNEKGYIEAEWCSDSDALIIHTICREEGYKLIRIECIWTTFPMPQKYIKIRLYDRRFGNVPETYIPKTYTDIIAPEDGADYLRHASIIERLQTILPKAIFISQFDHRIVEEKLPKTEGKEMIYVLNYDLSEDFEKAIKEIEGIDFCKLSIETTQMQAELFGRLGINIKIEETK